MKNSPFRLILFLFFLLPLHLAWAEDQNYQIELIIFSHVTESALRSEYWPAFPPQVVSPRAVELSALRQTPESQWLLKNEDQLLRRQDNSILIHAAWQVSANDARQDQVVHLQSPKNNEEEFPELDGSVGIRLERYFNIHLNLRFYLSQSSIAQFNLTNIEMVNNPSFVSFKLNRNLRMRSNELNYIDHPLYGVLMKIVSI